MRLKYLIFASTMLLFSIIIIGNAWHLAKLTDVTSSKLGQAAFNVSKSTVESLLAQRLDTGLIFIEQQLARVTIGPDNTVDEQQIQSNTPPLNRVKLDTSDFNFEQSVDLKLNDSSESRSILLVNNHKSYEIPIPRTEMEESIEQASNAIILTSVASFLFALVFVLFVSDRMTRPLSQIVRASKTIGAGQFSEKVPALSRFSSTEMKDLVNSINSMSAQLEALEKERNALQEQKTTSEISEISRGLAHSIRNPLHTIQLAVETLNDDPALTQQVKRQVQRIDHHIRELMTISTHDALSSDKLDIVELIQSIVNDNHQRVSIEFNNRISDSEQRKVLMIESELRSCFTTIINNAIEAFNSHTDSINSNGIQSENFNEPGQLNETSKISVDVSIDQEQTQAIKTESNNDPKDSKNIRTTSWQIVIDDNGVGIDEAIQQKLFMPHNTNKPHGAGMGLYIAQRIIVGRYSGLIRYERRHPRGSRFIVSLTHRNK
ncbi:MAG: HAMP domain-containing histidine kinase [Gammaproteobacteria bacterium]|nr:HAMP domain-containing histidine kinase [Gammaproteobacteria bacterium]